MQAILAGAFSAPFHTFTFTPELRGKLFNVSKFRGQELVQCVSNDVCFCLLQDFRWPQAIKKLAIQRNFQVPKC
jgi:hypothetical protein